MGDTHWLIHLSWGLSKTYISFGREGVFGLGGKSSSCGIRQRCYWTGRESDR